MHIFEKFQISCNLKGYGVFIASIVETQLLSRMYHSAQQPYRVYYVRL